MNKVKPCPNREKIINFKIRKYIGFSLLLLFISCYPSQIDEEEVTDTEEINLNSECNCNFSTIDDLISIIESSEQIEHKRIGIEGRKSQLYCCYEELLEIASDSLWIKLSYSKSPVMRYYACQALQSKESANLLSVRTRNRLIKDTTVVCEQSWDVIMCEPLGFKISINEIVQQETLDSTEKRKAIDKLLKKWYSIVE